VCLVSEATHVHAHHHDHPARNRAQQSARIDRYATYDDRRRVARRVVRNGELDNLEPVVGGASRAGVLGVAFVVDRIIHKASGTAHGAATAGAAFAQNVRNSAPVRAVGRFLNRTVLTPPVRHASRVVIAGWRDVRERPIVSQLHARARHLVADPVRNLWSDRRRLVATAPGAAVGAATSVATFMAGAAVLAGEHVATNTVARIAVAAAGLRYAMETNLYRVPARHVADAWRHAPQRLRNRGERSLGRELAQQGKEVVTATVQEWRGNPAQRHHCHHGPGLIRQSLHAMRSRRSEALGRGALPPLISYEPESVEDEAPYPSHPGIAAHSLRSARLLASRVVGFHIDRTHPDADVFRDLQTVFIRNRVRATEPFAFDDEGPRFWLTAEGGARQMAVVLGKLHRRAVRRGDQPPRFNLRGFSDVVVMQVNAAVRRVQGEELPRPGIASGNGIDAAGRARAVYDHIDKTFGSPDDFDTSERRARRLLADVLIRGELTPHGVRVDSRACASAFRALRTLTNINGMETPGIIDVFEPRTKAELQRDLRLVAERRAAELLDAAPYVGRHRVEGQRVRPAVCTDACDAHERQHEDHEVIGEITCEHPHHHEHAGSSQALGLEMTLR
jgi:hypothetical protein